MPVEHRIVLPWHRANCECDGCFEEHERANAALANVRRSRGRRQGALGKRFVAGFYIGWKLRLDAAWKAEGDGTD